MLARTAYTHEDSLGQTHRFDCQEHRSIQPTQTHFRRPRDVPRSLLPSGGRLWRLKFRLAGKEKCMSLGTYPDVSLAKARQRREACPPADLLRRGESPSSGGARRRHSSIERAEIPSRASPSSGIVCSSPKWTKVHGIRVLRALERDVLSWVGDRPIRSITAQELLVVLRRMEARGVKDSVRRVLQCCGRVFRFAVASGRADRDPFPGSYRGTGACSASTFRSHHRARWIGRAPAGH